MKKAWEVALSYVLDSPPPLLSIPAHLNSLASLSIPGNLRRPAKSLPMQAFMLYMSGSGIQIFSMGIVWMLLTSPWQAAWNVLNSTPLGLSYSLSKHR